jgi:adenosylcobinamide kinase/adenosylcobinamide-phosphate guanylyltransferase
MKIYDEAGRERVSRHRQQREGKGFFTIEKLYDIREVIEQIEKPDEATVLLECVTNLVGNEMFENPAGKEKIKSADEIAEDIEYVAGRVHNMIIVSNEYESDADTYDDATRNYIRLLDLVNERINSFSDRVMDMRKGSAD